jgi:hypothetical protein
MKAYISYLDMYMQYYCFSIFTLPCMTCVHYCTIHIFFAESKVSSQKISSFYDKETVNGQTGHNFPAKSNELLLDKAEVHIGLGLATTAVRYK